MPLDLSDQILKPGLHEATFQEIGDAFGGFQKSSRRLSLFARLRSYADDLVRSDCGVALIVDGSFVMSCIDEPQDIDLVLLLDRNWDFAADLPPFRYNLVSKRQVRKTYGLDVFPAADGSVEAEKWIEFFSNIRLEWCHRFGWPIDRKKGLLRVTL